MYGPESRLVVGGDVCSNGRGGRVRGVFASEEDVLQAKYRNDKLSTVGRLFNRTHLTYGAFPWPLRAHSFRYSGRAEATLSRPPRSHYHIRRPPTRSPLSSTVEASGLSERSPTRTAFCARRSPAFHRQRRLARRGHLRIRRRRRCRHGVARSPPCDLSARRLPKAPRRTRSPRCYLCGFLPFSGRCGDAVAAGGVPGRGSRRSPPSQTLSSTRWLLTGDSGRGWRGWSSASFLPSPQPDSGLPPPPTSS